MVFLNMAKTISMEFNIKQVKLVFNSTACFKSFLLNRSTILCSESSLLFIVTQSVFEAFTSPHNKNGVALGKICSTFSKSFVNLFLLLCVGL